MKRLKCIYRGDWFFAAADWTYGLWTIRIRNRALQVKAPWCDALFSERNRWNVRVLPLGGGWRILWRAPA